MINASSGDHPSTTEMARAGIRYYSEDDQEGGVTPSQLKRLGKAKQIAYMFFWFNRNFEDPAIETPYISEEGGFQFVWGGPYNALEQLGDEFGDIVPQERIEQVAERVERGGIVDWAPGTQALQGATPKPRPGGG